MPHREHINQLAGDINAAERNTLFTTKKVDCLISKLFNLDDNIYIVEGDVKLTQEFETIINNYKISLEGSRIQGNRITLDGDVKITEDFQLVGDAYFGGVIQSYNWGSYAGGEINLALGTIKFGGSVSPKFSVDADGKLTCTGADVSGKITVGANSSGIANLTDAGALAVKDDIGASDCDVTIIDGGKIITGLLTANNIQVGGMDAARITTGSLVVARTDAKCTDPNADQTSAHDCQHPGDYTSTIINGGLITTGTIQLSDGTNIKAGITATGVGDANVRIWAGDTYANRATAAFRITAGGALVATSATITGVITANTGYIGGSSGWTISSKTLTGANDSKIISGILESSDWGANAGSQLDLVNKTLTFGGSNDYHFKIDSSGNITAKGGTVGGWDIQTGLLRSAASGARIELNQDKNRISIFDAISEKVVMGYLEGLLRGNASGQAESGGNNTLTDTDKDWAIDELKDLELKITGGLGAGQSRIISSNTATEITVSPNWDTNPDSSSVYVVYYVDTHYGFWSYVGNYLEIDGDVNYGYGDWIIQHDGSLLIKDGAGNEIIRLGSLSTEKGLFIKDTGGNVLSKLISDEILIGKTGANQANLIYDTTNGLRLRIATTDKIKFDNSGNATILGTLTMGASGIIDLSSNGKLDLAGAGELTKDHLILSEDADYLILGNTTGANYRILLQANFGTSSLITFSTGATVLCDVGIDALDPNYFRIDSTVALTGIKLAGDVFGTGFCDMSGGYKDGGVAGVDGTFVDNNGNTVRVRGGIITDLTE